jgi:hypothetical protein
MFYNKINFYKKYSVYRHKRRLRRARHGNDEALDEDELINVRMENTDDLGRDIRVKMECLITNIKEIQLDLELLQRNDGIISLEALHSVGAVDSNYYGHFTGPNKEEV